jgi:hypothetical protein
MRGIASVLLLLAFPVMGQTNGSKPIKTIADYCTAISKRLDAMDDTEGDTLLSDLPEPDRPKLTEYLVSLRALRGVIHHDACDAKDLKSAKAATRRDLKKHAALTNEMLAYAHHAIAEAYRKKAQGKQDSK